MKLVRLTMDNKGDCHIVATGEKIEVKHYNPIFITLNPYDAKDKIKRTLENALPSEANSFLIVKKNFKDNGKRSYQIAPCIIPKIKYINALQVKDKDIKELRGMF